MFVCMMCYRWHDRYRKFSTARETLIFLLLNLGFVMNVKRSIHQPVKQVTLSLLKEKPNYMIQQCLHVYSKPKTSVLNLTKLIGLLSSIVLAIFFPTGANIRPEKPRQELFWWIENTNLSNGKLNSKNLR